MLRQEDGPRALLQRAGVPLPALQAAAENAVKRLPQVQGQEQVQVGPDLAKLLQATEKEAIKRGDQFIASELFLLAVIGWIVLMQSAHMPWSTTVFGLMVLGWRAWLTLKQKPLPSRWISAGLLLLSLALTAAQFRSLLGRDAGSALILLLLCFLLFTLIEKLPGRHAKTE